MFSLQIKLKNNRWLTLTDKHLAKLKQLSLNAGLTWLIVAGYRVTPLLGGQTFILKNYKGKGWMIVGELDLNQYREHIDVINKNRSK